MDRLRPDLSPGIHPGGRRPCQLDAEEQKRRKEKKQLKPPNAKPGRPRKIVRPGQTDIFFLGRVCRAELSDRRANSKNSNNSNFPVSGEDAGLIWAKAAQLPVAQLRCAAFHSGKRPRLDAI